MPRRKDENGKVYAWSDEGVAIEKQLGAGYAAIADVTEGEEFQTFVLNYQELRGYTRNIYLNYLNREYEEYYHDQFHLRNENDTSEILMENGKTTVKKLRYSGSRRPGEGAA